LNSAYTIPAFFPLKRYRSNGKELMGMSDNSTLKQIVVGSIVTVIGALAGTIFNLLFVGKLNLNSWWVFALGGALLALFVFRLYREFNQDVVSYGKRVALRTYDNSFVAMDTNKDNQLFGGAQYIRAWQLFEILDASTPFARRRRRGKPVHYGDQVAFKTINKRKMVGAALHNESELTAWVDHVREWESFTLCFAPVSEPVKQDVVRYGSPFALQAHNGKYIQCDFDNNKRLEATAGGIAEWETFVFVNPNNPNQV